MTNLLQKIYRWLNILAHRHLILTFVTAFLSYELVFFPEKGFSTSRLYCAVGVLFFSAIFFGKRGVIYSCYMCIGFFIAMGCYGYKINRLFPNFEDLSWNSIYADYVIATGLCWAIMVCFPIIKFISEKYSETPSKMTIGDLYPNRLDSYNTISDYLSNHSVIGIDSPYGNGKSTIVEILKNEKTDWTFITFGVLSASVGSIEFCIIREINRILESNGIFVNPVNKIKSFFSHDFTYCIGELLFEDQTYEKQIIDFVKGVQCLKQVIVLNFEDIDRIRDKDLINKIFSICDSLLKTEAKYKEQYIKVIFQCNTETINELFKEEDKNNRYAEKFIPHSIVLGALGGQFFTVILQQNSRKYRKIKSLKFDFLDNPMEQKLLQQSLSFEFINYTIRGIEQILDKVNFAVGDQLNLSIRRAQDAEAVVIFYIAMYFLPHVYDSLERNVKMDDQKLFYPPNKEDDDKISLATLRQIVEGSSNMRGIKINEFFDKDTNKKAKENKEALLFLSLLGYDDDFYNTKRQMPRLFVKRKNDIINKLLYFHSY